MAGKRIEEQFFTVGTQYYVSGRASAFASCLPVCGNLFHHAIEMYLKGYLSRQLSTQSLKKLRHDLRRTWRQFKVQHADPILNGYDLTVGRLNKFETIRYPDAIVHRGMFATVSITRPSNPPAMHVKGGPPPGYHIVVQDIDELVGVIFKKCALNPAFFFSKLNSEARGVLNRDNATFSS